MVNSSLGYGPNSPRQTTNARFQEPLQSASFIQRAEFQNFPNSSVANIYNGPNSNFALSSMSNSTANVNGSLLMNNSQSHPQSHPLTFATESPPVTATVAPAISWQSQISRPTVTNSHFISPFVPKSSVGAAAAAANLGSLVNVSASSHINDRNGFNHSPAFTPSVMPLLQQNMHAGSAFSPASGISHMTNPNFVSSHLITNNHNSVAPTSSSTAPSGDSDAILALRKELEQERTLRMQLQQRVVDLNQKMHSQMLVEQSYEDLAMKYKHVITQMQQMSLVVERYKNVIKQLEQDKRVLVSENQSLKAQENVAHDKTMLYNILMERSKKLEEENSSLVLENETYQRQYEKSVDDISKQVVAALLTQKALQEQCLQLQERLNDLERENLEYGEAIRQARQASSDSRLIWSYRGGRARAQTASPSADSVRSMPAQHLYWRQGSIGSLEHQQQQGQIMANTNEKLSSEKVTEQVPSNSNEVNEYREQLVCVETEFPANNGSPKSTRRSLDRQPSCGSLDSAYHSRGFIKYNCGKDVRCQRSISAEALRDMKVNMRRNDLVVISTSQTIPMMSSSDPVTHQVVADIHNDAPPTSSELIPTSAEPVPTSAESVPPPDNSILTDSGVINDPFAEDADDILSKHQSLIVGSMEDIFSTINADLKKDVIHEEEVLADSNSEVVKPPTPPPRPRSRCQSECSLTTDSKSSHCEQTSSSTSNTDPDNGPPPLPPKQYKGSRRPYKPLPAEPTEAEYNDDDVDSSDKNTDSESIKQEINALTSKITKMAASAHHH